jgi:polyisoprenoid-binding protein YceI
VSKTFIRRSAGAIFALPLLAACGVGAQQSETAAGGNVGVASAPQPQPAATTASSVPSSASLTAPAPASAVVFQITPGQSKATFRVREQLAGRNLPNDAVGTTDGVTGQIALQPDGTVAQAASRITVDVTSLKTDESRRDNFIKRETLQTQRFPTAEFVPTKIAGLPNPLPDSGQHTFTLTGLMTVHGVQKEIAWDVTAVRNGANLTGTATTSFKFGDFGMTAPKAPVVLSVVDEIRMEVALVASQAG